MFNTKDEAVACRAPPSLQLRITFLWGGGSCSENCVSCVILMDNSCIRISFLAMLMQD